jgi:predicted dehydrogenase
MKAAIVGTGFMGHVHGQAAQLAGVDLIGFAGSSQGKSDEIASEFRGAKGFASFEALLDAEPDIIHICTPNVLHLPQAKAAIARGINVIVEKPLAMNLAEADELYALKDKVAVTAMPFVYRYNSMVLELRKRLQDNKTNKLWMLHGTYLQDWLAETMTTNWRSNSAAGGATRAFGDIGVHWFDLMEFVTGHRVTRLTAAMSYVHKMDTEDGALVTFETDHGAMGSAVISQCSAGYSNRLWFSFDGTEESYSFDQQAPETGWVGGLGDNRIVKRDPAKNSPVASRANSLPAGHPQGYQTCFNDFVADAYSGVQSGANSEVMATFDDGHRAAQIIDAVMQSVKTGSWVDVAKIRKE